MVETLALALVSLAWVPSPGQQRGHGGAVESQHLGEGDGKTGL